MVEEASAVRGFPKFLFLLLTFFPLKILVDMTDNTIVATDTLIVNDLACQVQWCVECLELN